jgi:hypothetical protein
LRHARRLSSLGVETYWTHIPNTFADYIILTDRFARELATHWYESSKFIAHGPQILHRFLDANLWRLGLEPLRLINTLAVRFVLPLRTTRLESNYRKLVRKLIVLRKLRKPQVRIAIHLHEQFLDYSARDMYDLHHLDGAHFWSVDRIGELRTIMEPVRMIVAQQLYDAYKSAVLQWEVCVACKYLCSRSCTHQSKTYFSMHRVINGMTVSRLCEEVGIV